MSISQRRATVEQLLPASLSGLERALWALGLALYGVADVATTAVALSHPRGIETNGLAATAHDLAGVPGLVAHKLGALLVLVALWLVVSRVVDVVATWSNVPVSGAAARWIVPALTVAHGLRVVLANLATLTALYT